MGEKGEREREREREREMEGERERERETSARADTDCGRAGRSHYLGATREALSPTLRPDPFLLM